MKMTALTLCLLLLLSASTLMLAEYSLVSGSNSVESQPSNADYEVLTIYIRSDGSVEGTDLIERNGNVYTFKGDIGVFNQTISANTYLGGIVVERDNIVIDGAGYNLTGSGLYGSINPFGDPPIKIHTPGIDTTARRHVTIKNLTIQDFRYGIMLQRSANITVLSCEILRNHNGVDVYNSEQLTLINCKIESTWFSGVYMQNATRCLINNNTFANNKYGIHGGYGSYDGVMYHNNDYNVVFSNQFIGNSYAIQMGASSYNIFSNNVMNGSHWREGIHWSPYEGFGLYGEGVGNIVCGNYISGVNVAINIWSGKDNLFYMNNIANSSFGVKLDGGVNNTFYRNNFVDNGNDVTSKYPDEIVTGSSVFWDKDSVGNYWSKYNGSDHNWDGIGDNPYDLSDETGIAFGVDNFPIMSPVEFSGGYADLPSWAFEKLVALNLIEEPTADSDALPAVIGAAVFAASATAICAGLVVYFKKHRR